MAGTWTPHAPLHAFDLVCGELDGGMDEEHAVDRVYVCGQ